MSFSQENYCYILIQWKLEWHLNSNFRTLNSDYRIPIPVYTPLIDGLYFFCSMIVHYRRSNIHDWRIMTSIWLLYIYSYSNILNVNWEVIEVKRICKCTRERLEYWNELVWTFVFVLLFLFCWLDRVGFIMLKDVRIENVL